MLNLVLFDFPILIVPLSQFLHLVIQLAHCVADSLVSAGPQFQKEFPTTLLFPCSGFQKMFIIMYSMWLLTWENGQEVPEMRSFRRTGHAQPRSIVSMTEWGRCHKQGLTWVEVGGPAKDGSTCICQRRWTLRKENVNTTNAGTLLTLSKNMFVK